MADVGFRAEPYTKDLRRWLDRTDHYLDNAPPGAFFAVAVRDLSPDLFGGFTPAGNLRGLCVVGRPIARMLPQDGTWAEVLRLWLEPGLPHGTASAVLRTVIDECERRGRVKQVISYHDRTRHTGCIYRKAGFRRDGVTTPSGAGWASRARPASGAYEATPKRRWRYDLTNAREKWGAAG